MTEFRKIAYGGWDTCYQLSNGIIDLVITGEVGPRIIRFGFQDGANEFCEVAEQMGKTGGDEWRIYGGHRLWHAPEVKARTYSVDNSPVNVTQKADMVHVIQPEESDNRIQKELEIRMESGAAHVQVTHRLRNTGPWAVSFAPWALSVMAAGGMAILPLPPRGSHPADLLPVNTLTMWSYTDMSDPRWKWGSRYIMLKQDSNATTPQKLGASVPAGWAAHLRNGNLFVKRFNWDADATYADMNSSVEIFTNNFMLEVETLGPLTTIPPGGAVEHVEDWYLFSGVNASANDDDIDANILPHIAKTN